MEVSQSWNWHSAACGQSRYEGFRSFLLVPGRAGFHRRHSTACGQSRYEGFQRKMLVPGRNRRDAYGGITRAMVHCRAVRGTSHRLRFEKMDYSPRAAASADSGTALDGEAGRRNGLRSQSLPGRDRQQIKKEGDYQSEDFLVTLLFFCSPSGT